MNNKYIFSVGEIYFSINSNCVLDFPISFTKFLVQDKHRQMTFDVNLHFLSKYEVPDKNSIVEQRTYKWIKDDKILYYVFSKRSEELRKDGNPWVLVINGNICDLHIPSNYCNFEIFDRPWLHRIFSYFLPDDSVLVHGGCVLVNGNACLILGECGKGKSTFIDIASRCGIESICDDRFMLKFINDKLICFSTPWNQKNPNLLVNKSCLVKGICFLEHSVDNANHLTEYKISEKKNGILSQFYLPIPKQQLSYLVLFNKKIFKSNVKIWEYYFVPIEGAIYEFSNEFKKYFDNKRTDKATQM